MIISHDFGLTERKKQICSSTDQFDQLHTIGKRDVLMVGFDGPTNLMDLGRGEGRAIHLATSRFLSLSPDGFCDLAPELVLTPLVAQGHDVLDFARILHRLNFTGQYRAVVNRLPDTRIIIREVLNTVPDLNFGVIELSKLQG